MDPNEDNGMSVECPTCGAMPHDRINGHYQELRECPHCDALKCCVCDMGDDVSCVNCEGEEF